MAPPTNTPEFTPLQPKLAPKEPSDKKAAAKEVFLDVLYDAKSLVLEMVDDFKASDRFFKYKAGVIGSWVLLSVLAMIIACPSNPGMRSNSLDARILIKQVPALDRSITALYIENTGDDDWGDALLKLNNVFTHSIPDLKAGAKAVVTIEKFSGPGGKTPPSDLKPQKLEITCKRGNTTIDLEELLQIQAAQEKK